MAVLVAWLASLVGDFVSPAYDPPPTLHTAFMVILGAAFGDKVLDIVVNTAANRAKNNREKPPKP